VRARLGSSSSSAVGGLRWRRVGGEAEQRDDRERGGRAGDAAARHARHQHDRQRPAAAASGSLGDDGEASARLERGALLLLPQLRLPLCRRGLGTRVVVVVVVAGRRLARLKLEILAVVARLPRRRPPWLGRWLWLQLKRCWRQLAVLAPREKEF